MSPAERELASLLADWYGAAAVPAAESLPDGAATLVQVTSAFAAAGANANAAVTAIGASAAVNFLVVVKEGMPFLSGS